MVSLNIAPNLPAPDDFYEMLIAAHAGLQTGQSHAMNAALVLLLANHIGTPDVLADALQRARATVEPASAASRTPAPTPPKDTP